MMTLHHESDESKQSREASVVLSVSLLGYGAASSPILATLI